MNSKILSTTWFMLITAYLFSQATTYFPFPTGNAYWTYEYVFENSPTGVSNFYSLSGDTVMSVISYKKLYKNAVYVGALREDNKKVFIMPKDSSVEVMLYNFNLNIGDSVIHPFGGTLCYSDTVYVTGVSATTTVYGQHRTLRFNTNNNWIEGIGGFNDLLHPFSVGCLTGAYALRCFSTDSGLVYEAPWASCSVSSDEISYEVAKVQASPNPFKTSSVIRLPLSFQQSELTIYNAYGLVAKTEEIRGESEYLLSRGDMSAGIYFIQFKNKIGRKVASVFSIE